MRSKTKTLNLIQQLQTKCHEKAKATGNDHYLNLVYDLSIACYDVKRQNWRNVDDTITHAKKALTGDWSWRT